MSTKYDSIINLSHFHAPGKPFMSARDRAAQFMPFKSLKGYEEEIKNADTSTDEPIIIYDE